MWVRSVAAFVALVVLGTTGLAGGTSYLCSMGGEVRSSCCCHHDDETPADPCLGIEAESCCDVEVTQPLPAPTMASDAGSAQLRHLAMLAAILDATTPVPAPPVPDSPRPYQARGSPPAHGPPIFVLQQTYRL